MAAPHDRGALDPQAAADPVLPGVDADVLRAAPVPPAVVAEPGPTWVRYPSLLLVGGVLCVVLVAVALLQAAQLQRLSQAMRSGTEALQLEQHALELEYLRLREQLQRALDEKADPDPRALALRYEIWVSHVVTLRDALAQRRDIELPDAQEAMALIDAFIVGADRVIFGGTEPPSQQSLQSLHAELTALEAPVHEMKLATSHRATAELTERQLAMARYSRIAVALTLFLSLLALAFAGLSLRQMRQLDQRRRTLELMTGHLRSARREAEAASQAKSAFLANMSHEIRTPFQGLLGMLSLLRETGLAPRQIDYLRTATESANHLLTILNDILDVSQLEAGRLTLAPQTVELRGLLRDVEALMRPQAATKSLALHIDADPAVPDRVLLDPTRVKQILFNLLSNAIKFSERGAVVLDLRRITDDRGGDQLEFVVTDTGIGMDEATLARLFQRFSRGDESLARRHGGSGLGLEISRSLARLMGGDVTAQSRLGEGSRFAFRLPLQPAPAAAGPAAEHGEAAGLGRALHILVAEDNVVNRQVLAALFDSLGHHAHFVPDGSQAIDAARREHFDLVLMDLHMPVTDGVTATRAIRALPDRDAATVPIVALTADAFAEARERCLLAGMNDFLIKPVGRDKLAALLRQLFGPGSVAGAAAAADMAPQDPSAAERTAPPLIDATVVADALRTMSAERLAALVHEFLDQGPATVQRLRGAVRDAQPLELRSHAHAARGAAASLGLAALAAVAEALQDGAAHLPAHEIARLVQRFEDLLPRSREAAERAGLLLAPAAR